MNALCASCSKARARSTDRRRQALSDGGGRPDPHAGLTWHEHVHQGSAPIVWLDALDVPLHQYMGTGAFQPGRSPRCRRPCADAAFAVANVVPDTSYTTRDYSPVFRYPYASAAAGGRRRAARARLARGACATSIRSPAAPGMALMDCFLVQLDAGATTLPFRTSAELGVLRGGGRRREPDRQRRRSDGRSGTSSRSRKATGSSTRASAAPPGCSRSPTATCMPGSAAQGEEYWEYLPPDGSRSVRVSALLSGPCRRCALELVVQAACCLRGERVI